MNNNSIISSTVTKHSSVSLVEDNRSKKKAIAASMTSTTESKSEVDVFEDLLQVEFQHNPNLAELQENLAQKTGKLRDTQRKSTAAQEDFAAAEKEHDLAKQTAGGRKSIVKKLITEKLEQFQIEKEQACGSLKYNEGRVKKLGE